MCKALLLLSLTFWVGTVMAWDSNTFKKPAAEALKQTLSSLQYDVTQHEGTEKPFDNDYWNSKEPGLYVDVVSGEPLFSSLDKYDSGTGWPSFTKPLGADMVTTKTDKGLFYSRTEVRSRFADSHLGHVFDDGPKAAGGKRFCMNSAALRFIPVAKLTENGYGELVSLFQHK
ncbi:MAG: peptide-methionine (R)-S-oxide reductase MsrB [Methylococcaceae bacterium]|nr:peptide-methionine (R)-S-oxide reductase MsrB [Methylococcaceae bacterium]